MSSISFNSENWWWVAIIGVLLLIPLTWRARLGNSNTQSPLGLALRFTAIASLLICLFDPHWTSERASKGANIVAILVDNSQGLQIKDTGQELSRGETVLKTLAGSESKWLDNLEEEYQVHPYKFDRGLQRISSFERLDFTGDRSSIGKSLTEISERFRGQALQGVILLTDGNATDLPEGFKGFEGMPPIYPVIVGSENTSPDLSIEHIEIRQTAFDDSPLSLKTTIHSQNLDTDFIQVALEPIQEAKSPNGLSTTLAEPQFKLLKNTEKNGFLKTSFNWQPSKGGVQFYNVSAMRKSESQEELEDEVTLANNHKLFMVNQGQSEYRILYVTGRPNWEYKFLNRSLAEDKQLQMVGLIRVAKREPVFEFKGRSGESSNPLYRGFGEQSAEEIERYDQAVMIRVNTKDKDELRAGFPKTAEELFQYDAVIIDDLESDFFSYNQLSLIRRFVSERGGGLLLLGGADALEKGGYANTPLSSVLPLNLSRKATIKPVGELTWDLTRNGWVEPWVRIRSHESEERSRLRSMPPFKVINPLPSVKPGARVLATVEDKRGNEFPSLVAQNYGAGRVACVTVGDLWRWGLTGQNEYADLARFWRQLSRWLVSDTPKQIEIYVNSQNIEQTKLLVHARDSEYKALEIGSARVTIKKVVQIQQIHQNTEPETSQSAFSEVTLNADPVVGKTGAFETLFTVRDAGAYLASVEVTDQNGQIIGTAETGWVNDPATEEFSSLSPNTDLLEEIAIKSGGKVLQWSDLKNVSDELSQQPAPITETYSSPIWNSAWVFIIVIICLSAEWAIRRMRGLV